MQILVLKIASRCMYDIGVSNGMENWEQSPFWAMTLNNCELILSIKYVYLDECSYVMISIKIISYNE